jgi:carbon monoxide dehydrogenase subunit G
MASDIHKLLSAKKVDLTVADTFFILLILQKVSINYHNIFSENISARSQKLINKILNNIDSKN